jgi:hypothetical protein
MVPVLVVEMVPVLVVEMVPAEVVEMVPAEVVEMVPVEVVEMVPAEVVEIVPFLEKAVEARAIVNITAQKTVLKVLMSISWFKHPGGWVGLKAHAAKLFLRADGTNNYFLDESYVKEHATGPRPLELNAKW